MLCVLFQKTHDIDISFEQFKEILTNAINRDDETQRRKNVVQKFSNGKFEDVLDSYMKMVSWSFFFWMIDFVLNVSCFFLFAAGA